MKCVYLLINLFTILQMHSTALKNKFRKDPLVGKYAEYVGMGTLLPHPDVEGAHNWPNPHFLFTHV